MLDFGVLSRVVIVAALASAATMVASAWLIPRAWRRGTSWSWAIGAGTVIAAGATDQWPHWPPLEDRARFLTLVVPLVMIGESVASSLHASRAAWMVRLALAVAVPPILLHNSVYLADLSGKGSAEWSTAAAAAILCGLAVALWLVWLLLSFLQKRVSPQSVEGLLAVNVLAAAITVMLSGYYYGGLLGLGVAASIAGATAAAHGFARLAPGGGSVAMSVIGLFSVVLIGRYFGSLPSGLAAGLVAAPLFAWIAEARPLRRLSPSWHAAARLACVATPLIVVLAIAGRNFRAASGPAAAEPEASVQADSAPE